MQLTKHHGLGNDFLVALVDTVPENGGELARRWCHRTHGIGADGLIFATGVPSVAAASIDVGFTLFNSDGSTAEISGNGMRCFAHAIAGHLGCAQLHLTATTPAGPRAVDITVTSAVEATATVEMGPMTPLALSNDRVDEIDKLLVSLAGLPPVIRWATGDMGNPHIVIQVDDPAAVDLATVGPAVEEDFGGINVHFIAPRLDGSGIDMRVWERGAGITEACGSGACAVGAVALTWGFGASEIVVHMPGGSAAIAVDEVGIRLTGPSVFVAAIDAPEGSRHG